MNRRSQMHLHKKKNEEAYDNGMPEEMSAKAPTTGTIAALDDELH